MNRRCEADKQPSEAAKKSQPEMLIKADAHETKFTLVSERNFNTSQTSIQMIEVDDGLTNLESLGHPNPVKINRSPSPERGSKRNKIFKPSETNIALFNSSPTADNFVETKLSCMQLTEKGEGYLNNMIMALETGKLDVTTFYTVLPYICVEDAPTDEGPDQGEITLLCDDLIKKVMIVLSEKRDDVRIDGDEENGKSKKLSSIIEELENCLGFDRM